MRVRPLSEPPSVDSANFGHYGQMRKVAVCLGIGKRLTLESVVACDRDPRPNQSVSTQRISNPQRAELPT
jgi:hypothetical protein